MKSWLFFSSPFAFFVFINIPLASSFDGYTSCSNKFNCGEITNVGFPFWGYGRPESCGYPGLNLTCSENVTTIGIMGVQYRVLKINQEAEETLKLVRDIYYDKICSPKFGDTKLNSNLFDYVSGSVDVKLLYDCTSSSQGGFSCPKGETYGDVAAVLGAVPVSPMCKSKVVIRMPDPVSIENVTELEQVVREGFEAKYKVDSAKCDECVGSKGVCGYDWGLSETVCHCPNRGTASRNCSATAEAIDNPVLPSAKGKKKEIAIGIAVAVTPTILIIFFTIYISRKRILAFLKRDKRDEFDVEAFIRNYGSLTPKRYTYANVKKMTDFFKDKIGKGGYGTVYKGRLPDGLLVAVKVLSESKGNGEDFINEVASIGRTSHVNIVTLSGFCYERDKRALIYEFMPNGSLDNFIHKHGSEMANCRLEWKTLSEIAVGIARGLEYLHRGCNMRILHFDIKPQNILLDKDFCPKISDFGLAKLCETKESIVSMLGARGTAGYIAPEVFSRNFGGVSHKSDVYSYGMLILDMVGARKNLDSGVSHTSEMFPHYVYKDLELHKSEHVFGDISEEEKEVARKMTLISLWCIQTIPSDRPSMSKVVEMLEGPLDSLQIAPKPFLFSPTIAAEDSMTTTEPYETDKGNEFDQHDVKSLHSLFISNEK